MRAPPTQLRRLRPKHPSGNITQNLPPQIPQIPLKKLQLLPRRRKIQRIRHLQIHQPQLVRNHPLSPPPHQRIKPHLKLSLPTIPRQRLLPSLIIHHPHLTSRRHIHPINKPPHRHPIRQYRIHKLLTRQRIKTLRILHQKIALQQRPAPHQKLIHLPLRHQLQQRRILPTHIRPIRPQPLHHRRIRPLRSLPQMHILQTRMHQRAPNLGHSLRLR